MRDSLKKFIEVGLSPFISFYTNCDDAFGWLTKSFINGSLIKKKEDVGNNRYYTNTDFMWTKYGVIGFDNAYRFIDNLLPIPCLVGNGNIGITDTKRLLEILKLLEENIKLLKE